MRWKLIAYAGKPVLAAIGWRCEPGPFGFGGLSPLVVQLHGEEVMLSFSRFISLFLVATFLVSGCSGGNPSDDQARFAVAQEIEKKYGTLIDFRKVNGETRDINGQKFYVFHYRAATKLDSGWVWRHGNIMFPTGLVRGKPSNSPWDPKMDVVPAGATYVAEGKVTFRNTEKGWVVNDTDVDQYGYCDKGETPSNCYSTLWDKK